MERIRRATSGINGSRGQNLHATWRRVSGCGPRAKCPPYETCRPQVRVCSAKRRFRVRHRGSEIPTVPPPKRHPYDQWSPDARALDLVGDKWTLLIIRDLAAGPRRFVELQRVLPGISTEQLRSRLNRMVADGLLTRQRYREVPPRVDYELTERSRELMPVVGALARWGYDWTWSAPRAGEDINIGADVPPRARADRAARRDGGHASTWSSRPSASAERRYRLTAARGARGDLRERAGRRRRRPS